MAEGQGPNVTFRSLLNPVRLTFFDRGFEFLAPNQTVVVSGGQVRARVGPGPAESVARDSDNDSEASDRDFDLGLGGE